MANREVLVYTSRMAREILVHLLPQLFEPAELSGGVAVVLDILRATTTITHALAAGAREVIPTVDVPSAEQLAAAQHPGTALLGGEREGLLIPGFDLDNNPLAYTAERVAGKTIVFTTTNGTKALHRSVQAERVLLGAFVNLSAVCDELATEQRPIHVVCAGTKGKITQEDALCAGAIVDRLLEQRRWRDDDLQDDQAQLALHRYLAASSSDDGLLQGLRNSFGGRNCRRLRFDTQIERAATIDLFDLVPEYLHATGRIVAAGSRPGSTPPAEQRS
jgi:2-phosphosulfolactate phosphatase